MKTEPNWLSEESVKKVESDISENESPKKEKTQIQ